MAFFMTPIMSRSITLCISKNTNEGMRFDFGRIGSGCLSVYDRDTIHIHAEMAKGGWVLLLHTGVRHRPDGCGDKTRAKMTNCVDAAESNRHRRQAVVGNCAALPAGRFPSLHLHFIFFLIFFSLCVAFAAAGNIDDAGKFISFSTHINI